MLAHMGTTQAVEALKVRVCRMQSRLVLDGEGGQVRIGRQIARGAERLEEVEKDAGMAIARVHHGDVRTLDPSAWSRTGRACGQRSEQNRRCVLDMAVQRAR